MTKSFDTATAANCLYKLEQAEGPLTAWELARQLVLAGSRESQRRKVRAIIKDLRDNNGCRIVATHREGYWLTEDETIWRDYLAGRVIDAKRILAETHRRRRALNERRQMSLFKPPILTGEFNERQSG